jgi:peptide-methionine (S)-S-oxide reductase
MMIIRFYKSILLFVFAIFFAISAQGATPGIHAELAVFSGGSFWSLQPPFDNIPGVVHTEVGYTGGFVQNPTYRQVDSGRTGHVQAVRVIYDPKIVSYETLLNIYWQNIDPWDSGGQFCDRGPQYASVIFYINGQQRASAESSLERISQAITMNKPIATQILPAKDFFLAEAFHQKFYLKNKDKYKFFADNCGRAQQLRQIWSKAPEKLFSTKSRQP